MRTAYPPARLALLCLALACCLVACGDEKVSTAQPAEAPAYTVGPVLTDTALAMVIQADTDTDTLHASRYTMQIQNLTRQFPQVMLDPGQAEAIKRDILLQHIRRHVLLGEAKKRGVQVEEARVVAIMNQYKQQFPDEAAYLADLASRGETEADLANLFADQLRMEKLRAQVSDSVAAPAPEEVETYRQDHAVELKAQHILLLIPEEAADSTRSRIRAKAQVLLDSVKAGVDFASLARRYSEDPGSARQGGELPYFKRGVMVKPFEDAVFALPDSGAVAPGLVETQFGYHIIRLMGRRQDETMTLEKAAEELRAVRERDAAKALETRLLEKTTVRINPGVVQTNLEG